MTKIIIIVKNKFRINLICLLFPLLHAKKKENYFLGRYFRRVVILEGTLLSGFSYTCERVVSFETLPKVEWPGVKP